MRLPFFGRGITDSNDHVSYQIIEVIGASEQLGEAVERASEYIADRQSNARHLHLPSADLLGFALFAIAAGGAYLAARALLDRNVSSQRLPMPLQDTLTHASTELRHVRSAFATVIVEGRRAQEAATHDLREEYFELSGRVTAPDESKLSNS